MQPHRIHLRGPWQYEWLSPPPETGDVPSGVPLPVSGQARMPASWQSLFGSSAGRVRFSRRFHRPTNLDPEERVYVVFDGLGGCGRFLINGDVLGEIDVRRGSHALDVTAHLRPRNELCVELELRTGDLGDQPAGLWAPVVLEIRREE